jgi:hypothetical protein
MREVACWDMIMTGSVIVRASKLATAMDPHLFTYVSLKFTNDWMCTSRLKE